MRTLVFATHNLHKLREVRDMLPAGEMELVGLTDLGQTAPLPETADTLQGNALQKARFVKAHYGYDCFADDTGLEVEALGGAPGVYSARYAGEDCDSAANVRKLLAALADAPNRRARFRTVIALVMDGREHLFDMVVATGDNFGSTEALDMVMDAYRPFLSYPGAFVLGSNDYYSPIPKRWSRYLARSKPHPVRVVPDLPFLPMVRQMRRAGWLDLSNASGTLRLPTGTVSLLGTDDAHIYRDRLGAPASSWDAPDALRLGVTHAPYTRVVSALTEVGSDLILAGHTHGGQIGIPGFGAIITNCDISRPYAKGLKRWEAPDGSTAWLHVSAGLGTSPYAKVRIATRPEASLLHVYPA